MTEYAAKLSTKASCAFRYLAELIGPYVYQIRRGQSRTQRLGELGFGTERTSTK